MRCPITPDPNETGRVSDNAGPPLWRAHRWPTYRRYGAKVSDTPTLYEWAGGNAAIRRLIDAFYDRVESDDLLSVLFPRGSARNIGPTWCCGGLR